MIEQFALTDDSRIKYQQQLAQIMRPASLALFDRIVVKDGCNALCLNCGEGEVVFHLAGLVGAKGTVTGTDGSVENIHTARQLAAIRDIRNATFCQTEQFRPGNGKLLDLIHTRLLMSRAIELKNLMEEIRGQLIPGGVALFEIIDFSTCSSIPRNFAFDRFLELYTAISCFYWGASAFTVPLKDALIDAGFQQVKHQYVAPNFANGQFKHLPALTLASIRQDINHHQLASTEELEVLLYELQTLEMQTYTTFSLPVIHLVWGYRMQIS